MGKENSLGRYFNVVAAIGSGAIGHLAKVNSEISEIKIPQRECHSFNPQVGEMLDELNSVIQKQDNLRVSNLKGDLGLSRASIMAYYSTFTGWENIPDMDIFRSQKFASVKVIEEIESKYEESGSPLSTKDQLEIALRIAEGDLTKAVLLLAISSREMARGEDVILSPDLQLTKARMLSWKKCIKAYGYADKYEDTAGDNYHFWHGVLAGMSREEEVDSGLSREVKQYLCDAIYPNAATAVLLLRYKLMRKKGEGHRVIDRMGYEIGRAFWELGEDMPGL
jgi:hypothetical protein